MIYFEIVEIVFHNPKEKIMACYVKSFVVGVANGIELSLQRLDELTEVLRASVIHQVTDTYYSGEQEGNYAKDGPGPRIVRVIIYEKT